MIDPHSHDLIEREAPARGLIFKLRNSGWTDRLVLFLRVMAVTSMLKGLYHWAAVCGIIGEEGGFEAHPQSWQATTVFFSVIDLVAAVGLWLVAPWGAVVWLTSTVTMLMVQLFFEQVYGTDMTIIAAGGLAILAYLILSVLAAREHPR
ncbi:MAG TPA: DUF6163 family protein [Xanthobacteraceae bacterium]|nr:DUF6163 family protein [Xanthobacteraceae bacterium]